MNTQKSRENIIYLILWIMVFTFPVILSTGGNRVDWVRVAREVMRMMPFLLVFLVNNFLLYLAFREKRYLNYFLLAGLVVLFFSFTGSFEDSLNRFLHLAPPEAPQGRQDALRVLNSFFYNVVLSVLVIGLNNAIKITIDWMNEKKHYEELQNENLRNQLALLQNQINPHFLMNTLNNIHALIDQDREMAKDSVVKLSKLMRVLLYENENYTLERELGFLEDYIELMRIRVNENVDILFHYPEITPKVSFPPLLFVGFVENAFKHGILASGRSFIHIDIEVGSGSLNFNIRNSRNVNSRRYNGKGNIGLSNARKRLDLVYGDKYFLEIKETDESYEVALKIPLDYENKMPGR
jgi:hypothetical protein